MRPSELFAGARAVPVALGLTPKLQALRAQSDGETKDESIPLWQPLAKVPDASNVWHHQQVQDLVLKFWDLYRKDEDNTITKEDFAQLSLRFLRIFLPGLTQEEEKHLCQNCWQEAAAGRRRLSFLGFFPYLVRLVQSWTDSSDPNDYVEFLQNLLDRCTCFQVAGQEQPVFPKRLVTFRAAQRGDDLGDGFNDFMESVELVCSGSLEEVQVELQFEVQHGINFHSCFFEEHFEAPAEPCRRVWMDLGRVWPLGYASLVAIRSLRDEPPMTLNCSDKKADLLQSALETLKSQASEAQAVCQISEEGKVLVSQGEFAPRLFSAVVNEGMISGSFVLKPNRGSFMLKLSDLRKQLLLPQSNARWAAESMGSCKPQQCLPSFPDGRGLQPSDMVTYMQASLAELICQGLVECGERRPLFPGKGPEESALLCLSRFLRARNPLNTEMYAGKMSDAREEFLKGCALPSDLKEMTEKKMSPDYAWTSTETAKFQELCARFDEVFSQQS